MDLFDNAIFFFCGGKSDRFKALYWDGGWIYTFVQANQRWIIKMATKIRGNHEAK